MFVRSVRLTSANSSLDKLIAGEKLSGEERQQLRWAGSVIAGADSQSPYHEKSNLDCVERTEIAPDFYRALSYLKFTSRPDFLDNFYLLLKSGGKELIIESELKQGKKLIEEMARYAFTKLSNYKY